MNRKTLFVSFLVLGLAAVAAPGAIINVPGDFATIQGAIDAAAVKGDEIVVAAGVYHEVINFNGKAINLHSASGNPAGTIIDGTGLQESVVLCISGEGAGTVLEGFTITGGTGHLDLFGSPQGGGMFIETSNPTVTNCTFSGNSAVGISGISGGNSFGGGMFNSLSNPTVTSCTFSGNSASGGNGHVEGNGNGGSGYGGGMYNSFSSPTVTSCNFSGNSAAGGGNGLGGFGGFGYGGGMANYSVSSPSITKCIFSGNSAILGGSAASSSLGGGIMNNDSSTIVTGCVFDGNSASSGGGMLNSGNSSTITNCSFNGNMAIGNGLWQIQGGGGGMLNSGNSSTITNCTFSGNTANTGGGLSTGGSSIVTNCTFNGNIANDDNADGSGISGGMSASGSSMVSNCTFIKNSATFAGGMSASNSSIVSNCIFIENTAPEGQQNLGFGGGMMAIGSSMVSNCTFIKNSSNNGGGMSIVGNPIVANCTFIANSATDSQFALGHGGGMYNQNNSPSVTNCIFWDDTPDELFNFSGSPTVSFSNVLGGIGVNFIDGGGNIESNPLFSDALGPDLILGTLDDDLRLLSGSPCLDAGNNSLVIADAIDIDSDGCFVERIPIDLDGNPRFMDDPATPDSGCGVPILGISAIVDMGAFEFQGTPAPQVLIGDTNGNGLVNIDDLVDVLNAFGFSGLCSGGDINGNGLVNIDDLVDVLNAFGGCP